MKAIAIVSIVGGVAVALLHGCEPLKSGTDRGQGIPDSSVATADASSLGSMCAQHRIPAARPPVSGVGGDLDIALVVQRSTFGFASFDDAGSPLYQDLGFDLDGKCTGLGPGEGQGPSCLEPTALDSGLYNDFAEGLDNSAGRLANEFAQVFTLGSDYTVTDSSKDGLMIRVSDYGGGADDDQVDVALYVVYRMEARSGGDAGARWDGQDRWIVMQNSVESVQGAPDVFDVNQPRFHDPNAYVTQGVLVAALSQALWPAGTPIFPDAVEVVHHVVLSGALAQVAGLWHLEHANIGLILNSVDALSTWTRVLSPTGDGPDASPICALGFDYDTFKQRICARVDIASSGGPVSTPCDALTGGSLIEATQTLLPDVVGPPSGKPPPCAANVPDADSCDGL